MKYLILLRVLILMSISTLTVAQTRQLPVSSVGKYVAIEIEQHNGSKIVLNPALSHSVVRGNFRNITTDDAELMFMKLMRVDNQGKASDTIKACQGMLDDHSVDDNTKAKMLELLGKKGVSRYRSVEEFAMREYSRYASRGANKVQIVYEYSVKPKKIFGSGDSRNDKFHANAVVLNEGFDSVLVKSNLISGAPIIQLVRLEKYQTNGRCKFKWSAMCRSDITWSDLSEDEIISSAPQCSIPINVVNEGNCLYRIVTSGLLESGVYALRVDGDVYCIGIGSSPSINPEESLLDTGDGIISFAECELGGTINMAQQFCASKPSGVKNLVFVFDVNGKIIDVKFLNDVNNAQFEPTLVTERDWIDKFKSYILRTGKMVGKFLEFKYKSNQYRLCRPVNIGAFSPSIIDVLRLKSKSIPREFKCPEAKTLPEALRVVGVVVIVGSDGVPIKAMASNGSALKEITEKYVMEYRFEPYFDNGKPVKARCLMRLTWGERGVARIEWGPHCGK